MIVQRITFHVKPGSKPKAIEMIKEAKTRVEVPHGVLTYTNYIAGEGHVLIREFKFENIMELEEWWEKFNSHPDVPAFEERWNELVSGVKVELLTLLE